MATALSTFLPTEWTMADMLEHLGGIPPNRIRMVPPPGLGTENDVLESKARFGRICELIDGVLVEKTVGYYESLVAGVLLRLLGGFALEHQLGIVLGEGGTVKELPNQVRVPDVCFLAWEQFPGRVLPSEPIPALAPDLAVEVLSEGNTRGEMERKLRDYFNAGVRLVWYLDPKTRTLRAYTSPEESVLIREEDSLDGDDVLPGFRVTLRDVFSQAAGSPPAAEA
jgi:Uma2 family endonuclease